MQITRINHLENLNIDGEWDSAHEEALEIDEFRELEAASRLDKLILCGKTDVDSTKTTWFIWVDVDYSFEMSVGQQELYKLFRDIQNSTVYTVTTVGKLMEALKLKCSFSVLNRLENLQSIGAISGFR